MSVGNFKNQQIMFDKLVINSINRILQLQLGDFHENCNFDGPEGKVGSVTNLNKWCNNYVFACFETNICVVSCLCIIKDVVHYLASVQTNPV